MHWPVDKYSVHAWGSSCNVTEWLLVSNTNITRVPAKGIVLQHANEHEGIYTAIEQAP